MQIITVPYGGVRQCLKSSSFSSCRYTITRVIQANEPTLGSKSSIFPYAIKNDSVMTRGGMRGLGGLVTETLNHYIIQARQTFFTVDKEACRNLRFNLSM